MSWGARPLPVPKCPDPSFPGLGHQIPLPQLLSQPVLPRLRFSVVFERGKRDRRSRDKGGFGLGESLPPLESGFPQSSGQSREQPVLKGKGPSKHFSPFIQRC